MALKGGGGMLGLNIPSESYLLILIIAWKVYCGMFHFVSVFHFVAAFLCCIDATMGSKWEVFGKFAKLLRCNYAMVSIAIGSFDCVFLHETKELKP